jgi:hypothetical protein
VDERKIEPMKEIGKRGHSQFLKRLAFFCTFTKHIILLSDFRRVRGSRLQFDFERFLIYTTISLWSKIKAGAIGLADGIFV